MVFPNKNVSDNNNRPPNGGLMRVLAGAVGVEPTVHGIKSRCLTTWLRPIGGSLVGGKIGANAAEGKGRFWGVASVLPVCGQYAASVRPERHFPVFVS